MVELITRTEARKLGLKYYFTGEQCSEGHIADRFISTSKCTECVEEQNQKNRFDWEERSLDQTRKNERAKDALKFLRETVSEINESDMTGLLTNYSFGTEDLDILPRDRFSSQILGEEFYDTKLPCKNNHLSKRSTESGKCLACLKQQQEEYKPWAKVYCHERRARFRNADGYFSKSDIDMMLLSQDGICVYCPADFDVTGYHIDHIIPLIKSGSNWPDNLQLLCPTCNLKKSGKSPEQYEKEIGFIRNV